MKRQVKIGARTLEYTLIATPTRTSVLLQALPEGKIRVYAPKSARLRDMDALVKERIGWIDEMHFALDQETRRARVSETNSLLFEGRRIPVSIIKGKKNSISVENGAMRVETVYETDKEVEAQIKKHLCALALKRIREELELYAPTVSKPYGRIAIREQRTRWGSCSSKNNLNFNWKLILAPREALRYVVIHELCHLNHFNHSERFWKDVAERMPEYEAWKKWLKVHGKELVFP